ncbi:MAG: hypothetical protein ABSC08_20145 [Bryobacteraceae bacterium]|jgi:hypothetical protein
MNEERLEQIYAALEDADCVSGMITVLTALTDEELEAAFDNFSVYYSLERFFGAVERSQWMSGMLTINANRPDIFFVRTAFDAICDEKKRRKKGRKGIDVTGKVFGRLLVLCSVGTNEHGESTWLVKCLCGEEKVIVGRYLLNGAIKSCGCIRGKSVRNREKTLQTAMDRVETFECLF